MTTLAQYQERFAGLELAHAPFADLRKQGLAAFAAQGFPTKRTEDWRYTNVSDVERTAWSLERGDGAWSYAVTGGDASLVTSLGDDALVGTAASLERAPFVALNSALFQRGYSLVVPAGHVASEPLFLTHTVASDGEREVHPRGLVHVQQGAKLTLVEEWLGEGPADGRSFTNGVLEVVLDEGAILEHHVWQRQGAGASFISTVAVKVAASARYESFGLWLGGALSRVDLNVALDGEEAFCRVDGVYVAAEQHGVVQPGVAQHVDVHSAIDHRVPHGTSRQVYKGLMGERGHAVFNGKVYVREGAQKTDAAQANHNLLLADSAEIDTKPQLEIFADDVKCSHGTTVGQLDPEQLFYLRSRGLSHEDAAHMLTDAFALEILDEVTNAAVRERAEAALREKLRTLAHDDARDARDGGAA